MAEPVFQNYMTVDLVEHQASDIQVARAAWVSTVGEDAREKESERIPGLINFLMRDRHGSPFEHGMFTFMIKCPIFVVREFHRHRAGWSYNEMSGRYTELKPEFYVPDRDRNLVQVGKPGAYTFSPGSDEQYHTTDLSIREASRNAWFEYQLMLRAGIAKEVARMVLPLNIYTAFYATCNPRSLMHFLGLRANQDGARYPGHPMKEIQMVADQLEANFKVVMPLTHEAFNKNGRVAP